MTLSVVSNVIWSAPAGNNFSAVRGLGYLEILFGIVFTKFIIFSSEEISDFRLRCGRFFPGEFKLIFLEF